MMLRFRKMMAVLLAAALTLTMLTACGGGGSGRGGVDAKVKLTNDINSILPEGYPKVKYDKELDNGAYTFQGAYIKDKKETNDTLKNSHRWMTKVEIDKNTSDKAKAVAEEVEKYMVLDSKNRDWSIGYYIETKKDKDNKVTGKDIYVLLEWKEKAKK